MKSVLISIQPKWCELIASGKKTIEVRKTAPKLDTPFKCYIYCTLSGSNEIAKDLPKWYREKWYEKKGKIIGEFVCNDIEDICCINGQAEGSGETQYREVDGTCLTRIDFMQYGKGKILYGWHVSDLKIYDKPKELGEYSREIGRDKNVIAYSKLTRPPQSWCYVEE